MRLSNLTPKEEIPELFKTNQIQVASRSSQSVWLAYIEQDRFMPWRAMDFG